MNENKFFSTDLDGVTVTLAMYVPSGTQKRVHANRSDHGFAIYANAESVVEFDTGKTFSIGDGQALFFPRGSNYVVKSTIGSGGCYAINFLCPPLDGAEPFVVTTKNREAFLSAFRKASQAFVSRLEGYKEVCLAMLAAVAARIGTGPIPERGLARRVFRGAHMQENQILIDDRIVAALLGGQITPVGQPDGGAAGSRQHQRRDRTEKKQTFFHGILLSFHTVRSRY